MNDIVPYTQVVAQKMCNPEPMDPHLLDALRELNAAQKELIGELYKRIRQVERENMSFRERLGL